jgi:hypothetical protein
MTLKFQRLNLKWKPLITLFPCLMLCINFGFAADEQGIIESSFLPTDAAYANWAFSGVVTNENGERYGYLFQMQREENTFHSIAALFNAQTKEVIAREEGRADINASNTCDWVVGHSFLRFNPINTSWIFGFKNQDKNGFNFKVDMLKQPEHDPLTQALRHGVEFVIRQTGQLNGHVYVSGNSEEEFVTAKSAWFRQIWLANHQDKNHQLSGVLCRFNDGSGFYSMNMPEPDAIRGAIAGWFDAQGMPANMSQFINVKQAAEGGPWHIKITSPNLHLVLNDFIQQDSVVAGFVNEKDLQGFCMLSQDAMGEKEKTVS